MKAPPSQPYTWGHNQDTARRRLRRDLHALLELDPRLDSLRPILGEVKLRTRPAGFVGLARIVCGQQVSVASAEAIWGRLAAIPEAITPHGFLELGEHGLTGVGLSRPKFASLTAIAQAITAGTLDLDVIEGLPAQDAIDALVIHKGIGPWTAEVYLSFCSGHRDIFPSGDLALQKGAAEALGLELLPDRPTLSAIASAWAPYRSAAALLLWRYYASTRGRKAIPV